MALHSLPLAPPQRLTQALRRLAGWAGLAVVVLAAPAVAQNLVGWGASNSGVLPPPDSIGPVVSMDADAFHAVVIRSGGTVAAWGLNSSGQCTPQAGLSSVVEVSAGLYHSMARRADGSVVAWGGGGGGEQNVPADLGSASSISAGSFFSIAARTNGTVRAWGRNDYGQATPPASLEGVTRVAAGESHGLALSSGLVYGWGRNTDGQASPPAGLVDVGQIAAGRYFSAARRGDGGVVCWGSNVYGESTPPPGLGPVSSIAVGSNSVVALRTDGSLAVWGYPFDGLNSPPIDLSNVVAIACGSTFALAAVDLCPDDPAKVAPGACGCGTPETGDTDGDGIADCNDPDDDDDGTPDGSDGCPADPLKTTPQQCGCGLPEGGDRDADGARDCVDQLVDPGTELLADDGAAGDRFGGGIAFAGVDVIIGASRADVAGRTDQGAAYVFRRNGTHSWQQAQKLTAQTGAAGDTFGYSIAASENYAVIGSAGSDVDGLPNAGAAFVFERQSDGVWVERGRLVALDGRADDEFGYAVAIDGERIVVGAHRADVNGVSACGAIYVFARDSAGSWQQEARLVPLEANPSEFFGIAVDLGGDLVIGASNRDQVGAIADAGSATIFRRQTDGSWVQDGRLEMPGLRLGDYGNSVGIRGTTAFLGSGWGDVGTSAQRGYGWIYDRDPTAGWQPSQRLVASDGGADDYFGSECYLAEDRIVVGAHDDTLGSVVDAGSAYLLQRVAGGWVQRVKFRRPTPVAFDQTGQHVAISGDLVVIGSRFADVGAVDRGAAYLIDLDCDDDGLPDPDLDGDTWPDCTDPDIDGDSIENGADGCPTDPQKSAPGLCGCGTPETDSDADGVPDCLDPDDDDDGIPDGRDPCPTDPSSEDFDGDGLLDCLDPDDDNDGTPDSTDECRLDPLKTSAGQCGCGTPEGIDSDGDGVRDCVDGFVGSPQRLSPSVLAANSYFGLSIDAEGDLLVVGAPGGLDVGTSRAGRAYLYRLTQQGTFVEIGQPVPGDGAPGDAFGMSVVLSGQRLLVGAPGANASAGAVYRFEQDASGAWQQTGLHVSIAPAAGKQFGSAIATDGSRVVVGAIGTSGSAGAIEVYAIATSGSWTHEATLTHPGATSGDFLGGALTIEGDRLAAWASGDDVGPTANRGSLWVSERSAAGWSPLTELPPSTSEGFVSRTGREVFARGASIFAGVHNVSTSGRFEEFEKVNGEWTSVRRIRPSAPAYDALGWSFAVHGEAFVAGAPLRSGGGGVYRLAPAADGRFVQTHLMSSPTGSVNDWLGYDVEVLGDLVIASAPQDARPGLVNIGTVTVFRLGCAADTDLAGEADCTDPDDDGDGVDDVLDECPLAAGQAVAGACGCGVPTVDTDADGVADCDDADDDGDGAEDVTDGCPFDPQKTSPGPCGCGAADVDSDSDRALDCLDADDDGDGSPDASDGCPLDPQKTSPGACGCGRPEGDDADQDGVRDCADGAMPSGVKILAQNGAEGDLFGTVVASDGDLLVTGAPHRDVGALANAGAAYFHRRLADGSWLSEGMVVDPTPAASESFGYAVAISGDLAAIGCPKQTVGTALNAGAVAVFRRGVSGAWLLEASIANPLAGAVGDGFGLAVALDGNTLVVGAYNADSEDFQSAGAVLVYRRSTASDGLDAQWALQSVLQPNVLRSNDRFGRSVAIEGDLIAVGAPDDDVGAALDRGSVHLYRRTASGGWAAAALPFAPPGGAGFRFGTAVDVGGGVIAVGEPGYAYPQSNAGRVTVIRRTANDLWQVEATLAASVPQGNAEFGRAISIRNGVLAVGAPGFGENANAARGAVQLFAASTTGGGACVWTPLATVVETAGSASDEFGSSVALGEGLLLAGSPRDDELGRTDRGSVSSFALRIADCNGNGAIDVLEAASGEGDCDGNGIPDTCEGIVAASYTSPDAGPIGGTSPVQIVIPVEARATADVVLSLRASANLAGSSRFLLVSLDGGTASIAFNGSEGDCASPPNFHQLTVPKPIWNAAASDGSIVVRFTASPTVSATACGGQSMVGCSYAYVGVRPDADCNGNAVLDRCEAGADFADCNRNGIVDVCEIGAGLVGDANANGVPDPCEAVVRVGPGAAHPTIEDALAAAFDGQTIEVDPGTYGPIDLRGRSVVIRTSGPPGSVVIDAVDAPNAVRIPDPVANGGVVAIDGIVARGASGRGVLILGGNVLLERTRVTANLGGGIEAAGDAVVAIESSRIDGNAASEGAGGLVGPDAAVALAHCVVEGNAAVTRGGGMHTAGSAIVEACVLEANLAQAGGSALSVAGPGASLEVLDSDFCRHAPPVFLGSWTDLGGVRLAGDCNVNGVCDLTEIDGGAADVDDDLVLDACEADCDGDHVPDDFEIATGREADVDGNGVPDQCQPDCDADGLPDSYEIAKGATDLDANGVPDSCQPDCDADGRPDAWELATGGDLDCNSNATIDSCDIASGAAPDCNSNGVPDTCDLAAGISTDLNLNVRPDECEFVVGGSGYATVQAAISAAPSGSTIEVAAGSYGSIAFAGKSLLIRAIGGVGSVAIDGGLSGRAAQIGPGSSASFEGIVFRNGRAPSGAGVLLEQSAATFIQCHFTGNVATERGGGLRTIDMAPRLFSCTFLGNGAAVGGAAAFDGSATERVGCTDCILRDNAASETGGAIVTQVGLDLVRTTIESNDAGVKGAALSVEPSAPSATIRDSRMCLNVPRNVLGVIADLGGNTLSDDCDGDGACDVDEIAAGLEEDCNANGLLDECELLAGSVPDCNANGVPDSCDIAEGTSQDVEPNGIPDECKPDCDGDGLPDAWEISEGTEPDCNGNGVPDRCDIVAGASDCDVDGNIDGCEIASGAELDCDASRVLDRCEIAGGASDDDGDGELDRCNFVRGDFDLDDEVGAIDLSFLLALWSTVDPPFGDLDGNGEVSAGDLAILLANWGPIH